MTGASLEMQHAECGWGMEGREALSDPSSRAEIAKRVVQRNGFWGESLSMWNLGIAYCSYFAFPRGVRCVCR